MVVLSGQFEIDFVIWSLDILQTALELKTPSNLVDGMERRDSQYCKVLLLCIGLFGVTINISQSCTHAHEHVLQVRITT